MQLRSAQHANSSRTSACTRPHRSSSAGSSSATVASDRRRSTCMGAPRVGVSLRCMQELYVGHTPHSQHMRRAWRLEHDAGCPALRLPANRSHPVVAVRPPERRVQAPLPRHRRAQRRVALGVAEAAQRVAAARARDRAAVLPDDVTRRLAHVTAAAARAFVRSRDPAGRRAGLAAASVGGPGVAACNLVATGPTLIGVAPPSNPAIWCPLPVPVPVASSAPDQHGAPVDARRPRAPRCLAERRVEQPPDLGRRGRVGAQIGKPCVINEFLHG